MIDPATRKQCCTHSTTTTTLPPNLQRCLGNLEQQRQMLKIHQSWQVNPGARNLGKPISLYGNWCDFFPPLAQQFFCWSVVFKLDFQLWFYYMHTLVNSRIFNRQLKGYVTHDVMSDFIFLVLSVPEEYLASSFTTLCLKPNIWGV